MEHVDVAIVGAGLAGLACAQLLDGRGYSVVVLDGADRVGGRVATDRIDGFTIDRGFQLLNPAYPALPKVVDLKALKLRALPAGVRIARTSTTTELLDPRRNPFSTIATLRGLPGTRREQLRLAAYLAGVAFTPNPQVHSDSTIAERFAVRGIRGPLLERLLAPFLAGVTLDPDLETSARFVELVLRSMLRGTPAVPANGMGALPAQMASRLGSTEIRLNTTVASLTPSSVHTSEGSINARTVVVAADGPGAASLLPSISAPPMRSVTTWWHATTHPVETGPLWIDVSPSPITNVAAMSGAAPSYAPPGRGLVAASTPGLHPEAATEHLVRQRVAELVGCRVGEVDLVATSLIEHALPAMVAPLDLQPPLSVDGCIVAGDFRATASIQGALASGCRAGRAVVRRLARMGSA
jgi:predicted NAD/FAD-dependent oxidoreductase